MEWKNTTKTGYVYDRRIFLPVLLIAVGAFAYLVYNENFDLTPHAYVKCDAPQCYNPLYGQECKQTLTILFFIPLYTTKDCATKPGNEWMQEEILQKGEYGEKQSSAMFFYPLLVLFLFVGGMVLNHYVHNKGKKFDLELRVTDKLRWGLKDIQRLEDEKR